MQDLQHAFPNQEQSEAVFVFARPYWATFMPTLLVYVFIFAFSLFLQYLLVSRDFIGANVQNFFILSLGIFQLFALSVFFVTLLDFYYDIVIVTDRRLANLTQEQLFYRKFAQFNMEEVEDVNATVRGVFGTLFDYGSIQVQTAGEQENFIIPNLRYPNEICSIISSLAAQTKDDMEEMQRFPKTHVIAVIEGQPITSAQDLASLGAIVPSDLRVTDPAPLVDAPPS